MRTFITIVALLFFSLNAQSQETRVASVQKDHIDITLFDISENAEALLLKKEQVTKIEALNKKTAESKDKVTQKVYAEELSVILTKEQMEKWKPAPKKTLLKKAR